MIQISLKTLFKILAKNNISFTTETLLPASADRHVVRFVVSNKYSFTPSGKIYDKQMPSDIAEDKAERANGVILCHYNLTKEEILSSSISFYQELQKLMNKVSYNAEKNKEANTENFQK